MKTEDLEAAIGRIAASKDGKWLRLWLQRHLMALGPGGEDGALRLHEGGFIFAHRFIALMDRAAPVESKVAGREQPV